MLSSVRVRDTTGERTSLNTGKDFPHTSVDAISCVVVRRVFTVDVDKLQAAMRDPLDQAAGEQRASADQHHDRRDPPVPLRLLDRDRSGGDSPRLDSLSI